MSAIFASPSRSRFPHPVGISFFLKSLLHGLGCAACTSVVPREKTMKIFLDWMRRKLHPSVKYSQVSLKKGLWRDPITFFLVAFYDAFGGDDEQKQEVFFQGVMEKEPLLLHDVLDGILTIGTLGHQGSFLSPSYCIQEDELLQEEEADMEVEEIEEGKEVAPAIIDSIKVKLVPVEAEVDEMKVVVQDEEESPLLEEENKKRERGRTTLADLFAAENPNEGANAKCERTKTAMTKKQEKRISPCTDNANANAKAKAKAKSKTTTNTKLQKVGFATLSCVVCECQCCSQPPSLREWQLLVCYQFPDLVIARVATTQLFEAKEQRPVSKNRLKALNPPTRPLVVSLASSEEIDGDIDDASSFEAARSVFALSVLSP
ncbi:hypothetical protein GW17_00034926 [Ensete ventricosum]|nr:hypothetical protein GW17_00034926 [Ensete ventricosum]